MTAPDPRELPPIYGDGKLRPVSVEDNAMAWDVAQAARSLQAAINAARLAGLRTKVDVVDMQLLGDEWADLIVTARVFRPIERDASKANP